MYQPGDIYFSNFPKFVQRPDTRDFNIDSMKVNPSPRPMVVLQDINSKRLVGAPISSDKSGMNNIYPSFVPVRAADYPSFLRNDSYIKLNQIQRIDTKWLYPSNAPVKVGQLKPIDLDRVRYFSLYATQTEPAYAKWITDIVSKNVKQLNHESLARDIIDNLGLPQRRERRSPAAFERNGIYKAHFQPEIRNPSTEILSGEHLAIMMVDGKYAMSPNGQSVVIPLIENTKENAHLSSANDVGIHMDGKVYRAAVSQMQPMNWDWIGNKVGTVDKQQMLDLDRSVVDTLGLKDNVIEKSREAIHDHILNKPKIR